MILTTTVTERDLQKQLPCLEGINKYSIVQNHIVCLDCQPELEYFRNLRPLTISSLSLPIPEDRLPQSGLTVSAIPRSDENILVIDNDMIMQRPFSSKEIDALATMEDNAVYLLPEKRWHTMSDALGHVERDAKVAFYFPEYHQFTFLRTEVIAARRSVWDQLAEAYEFHWNYYQEVVHAHPSWLVSYIIQHGKLDIKDLPNSFWEVPLFIKQKPQLEKLG